MLNRKKPRAQISAERIKRKKRYGKDWNSIRDRVYQRFGYRCYVCNEKSKILHAHHIILLRLSKSNDERNLVPLCPKCHKTVESVSLKMLKEGRHRYEIVRWLHTFAIQQRAKNRHLLLETKDNLCDTVESPISTHIGQSQESDANTREDCSSTGECS